MKNIPSLFAIASLLALFALVFSCKKDIAPSTPENLLGKWNLVSAEWNDHINGADHKDSSAYGTGELNIEFKNNGTVISSSPFHADTMPYKILDAYNVLIADDTLKIRPLTSTSMQVYFRNLKNVTGDYYEEWDRLKK
jgi:hypothetical protein